MSDTPVHAIIETCSYSAQLDRLQVTRSERDAINDQYAAKPDCGAVLKRTGGLRKGRVAKDGTGKSGGYRVFSFYLNERTPVFLLWIIDKSRDDTLTDAQEQTFRQLTVALKQEFR